MSNRPKLSRIVANQLPEFIREDYPTFVAFLEAYYEFLEQQDVDLYAIRDIDKTLDRFIEYFKNEVAPQSTASVNGDQRFLLSNIKDQHLAKGSEASYKLLFRLLFNKNVTVEYPGKQILRASDGKWNQDVSVFARVNAGDPNSIVGRLVEVITPNRIIRVLVDRRQDVEIEVDRFVQISEDTYEFYIDRRFFGDISVGDRLRYEGIFDATIVATTAKVTVLQKGRNFRPGQLYPIRNGAGTGSILKVKSTNTQGGITAAEFVKYGIGYETDFTATVIAEGGQTVTGAGAAALNISTITNTVTGIEILNGGTGYTNPTVVLSGGGFTSAATIGEVVVEDGVITKINVATPGTGYVTTPTVIITDPTGDGAAATAILGTTNGYGIFETTTGFNEQGYINAADYTQDVANAWTQRTTYATGDQLYWAGNLYDVTVGGLTGTNPPTHTSGSATNGTVTLTFNRVHGAAWEGSYSGEVLREFFFDSKDEVIDPEDPAIFKIELGPLTKYPGYYKNNDGFLDDAIFIQDSRYYQAYSYVLKIDERLESYRSAVKTLIHPSGMALFGEYDIRNEFDVSVDLKSMVKILVVNAQDNFSTVSEITAKDFGKALESDFSLTDSNVFGMVKPLAHSVLPQDTVSAKDFGKLLVSDTDGFSEVRVFSMQKPLAHSIQTPVDTISSFNITKPLAHSVEPTDANVFTLSKPLAHSISTPIDVVSSINMTKPLQDVILTPAAEITSKGVTKPIFDVISTPLDVISAKDFGKLIEDTAILSDVTTLGVTKYITDETLPTDSGNLFFNPYVADPYPTNYWAADYTEGESSFIN